MAKGLEDCYPYTYDYDNSKGILGDDAPRKMIEFIIMEYKTKL